MIQHDGKIKMSGMFTIRDPGRLEMVLGFIHYLKKSDSMTTTLAPEDLTHILQKQDIDDPEMDVNDNG
jgi:hypothetical protein